MIFLNYRLIAVFGTCILLFAGPLWLFRAVKARRTLLRIPTQVTAGLMMTLSALLLTLFSFETWITTSNKSQPLYSPDGTRALRVIDNDAGAIGGDTEVVLYSAHGLLLSTVFAGGFAQTDHQKIRWVSNNKISIEYDDDPYNTHPCKKTPSVAVECELTSFSPEK